MKDKQMSAFDEPQQESKFMRKVREFPFMPIGIVGCLAALGFGVYNYKNRGSMSTSVYLMHLRVKAQAMVVGALTIGAVYNIYKTNFMDDHHDEKKK